MNLVLNPNEAVEREQQGRWLHGLYEESKRLHELSQAAARHYAQFQRSFKEVAAAYENINALLVATSRYFSDVSTGSRIGVGTNVKRLSTLARTMSDSPQAKDITKLLKTQIEDAEKLKSVVKGGFGALKQRDERHTALTAITVSPARRQRQAEAESRLGKEVRSIYAETSRTLDKECIALVRAWTTGAGAIVQLVRDQTTRSLLAGAGTVENPNGYTVTGVVQSPHLVPEQQSTAPRPAVTPNPQDGQYGQNGNEYVSDVDSEVRVAFSPHHGLHGARRAESAGVALEFVERG
ncbi:hypothetical protein NESM_000262900 [Novymonas esmeraldas]|uniref:Uncharacterized protein n=1 Tax=Novymonas esmeraldas TaxID=1808958 RepID=A0AAW0FB10_9TRYP